MEYAVSLSFIWWTGKLSAHKFLQDAWKLKILCCSIKLYPMNGFVDICKRRLVFGERWLMGIIQFKEVVGAQRKLKGPTGCAFGGI
jgi:hypothetical protein